MTITTAKSVIDRFLAAETSGVLALKGAWGVGKTFAWHRIVRDVKNRIMFPSYCYVSLLGISSLSELRIAIFANTQSTRMIGEKVSVKTINEEWLALGGGLLRTLTQRAAQVLQVPYVKNLSIGLDSIAPHLIKNTLICLDDFERLSDNISPDELLGFISELK